MDPDSGQPAYHHNPDNLIPVLAQQFTAEPRDYIVQLPPHIGKGKIWIQIPAKGCSVVFWDARVDQPREVKKPPISADDAQVYVLTCVLTPDHLQMKVLESPDSLSDVSMLSAIHPLFIRILPGQQTRAVIISVTKEWLEREFKNAEADLQVLIHELNYTNSPFLYTKKANSNLYHEFSELHQYSLNNPSDHFYINVKILAVFYELLHQVLVKEENEEHGGRVTVRAKMLAVEAYLMGFLDKNLPPIQTIAKEMAMSESTLKRNFKEIYGMSIYDFYLQKKMQYARSLLDEQSLAVKEVAYRLGYQKTSNFIETFRKYYDSSPGALRKQEEDKGDGGER